MLTFLHFNNFMTFAFTVEITYTVQKLFISATEERDH